MNIYCSDTTDWPIFSNFARLCPIEKVIAAWGAHNLGLWLMFKCIVWIKHYLCEKYSGGISSIFESKDPAVGKISNPPQNRKKGELTNSGDIAENHFLLHAGVDWKDSYAFKVSSFDNHRKTGCCTFVLFLLFRVREHAWSIYCLIRRWLLQQVACYFVRYGDIFQFLIALFFPEFYTRRGPVFAE